MGRVGILGKFLGHGRPLKKADRVRHFPGPAVGTVRLLISQIDLVNRSYRVNLLSSRENLAAVGTLLETGSRKFVWTRFLC